LFVGAGVAASSSPQATPAMAVVTPHVAISNKLQALFDLIGVLLAQPSADRKGRTSRCPERLP
jgi:hypothetical protein